MYLTSAGQYTIDSSRTLQKNGTLENKMQQLPTGPTEIVDNALVTKSIRGVTIK